MTAPEPQYVDERLAWWAERMADAEAMRYGQRTWTWAEWDDRVRSAAGGLHALGVRRADVVAFLDKNHPACVEISNAAAPWVRQTRSSTGGRQVTRSTSPSTTPVPRCFSSARS